MTTSGNQTTSQGVMATDIADHISAMLAYWDNELVCRFANKAYLDWFGRSKEEMIDKLTIDELLGPDLFEKNKPYIMGVLNGVPQSFEREILTPSGLRYSLANYNPKIIDGNVTGFYVHVADVTPIKLLEKELYDSAQKIKEQNNRLMNFANIVSHNLKSYANNLAIMLDFLVVAKTEEKKNTVLDFLKEISGSFSNTITHLTEIVQVKNLEKLKTEKLNLAAYFDRSIKVLKLDLEACKGSIRNLISPDITVMANPAYLDSITLNLLSNAIKYKSNDRPLIIEVNAYKTESEVVFSVKDNGLGINLKAYGKDIFGMYKTFHSNADAKGVGLYLVRSQVEAMNGTIDVESEESVGTTFTIHFTESKEE